MAGCGACCGCDHSTRCAQPPCLVDLDDVRMLLQQAVANTAERVCQVRSGEMSPEELEAADEKLARWLAVAFCGGNPHFTALDGWNPEGLAASLRERIGEYLERAPGDDEEMVQEAMTLFVALVHENLSRAARGFVPVSPRAGCAELVERWGLLLTGAPDESFF